MTPEDFYKALKELGFNLSQKQKDQFQRYFELLVDGTKRSTLLQSQKETRSTSNISMILWLLFFKGILKIKVFDFWISELELDFQVSL